MKKHEMRKDERKDESNEEEIGREGERMIGMEKGMRKKAEWRLALELDGTGWAVMDDSTFRTNRMSK